MNSQMIIRVDPELKNKVARFAKAEGKNVSEVVRELLDEYVANRDSSAYIDDLWDRIGRKLSARNISEKDIPSAIKAVRSGK